MTWTTWPTSVGSRRCQHSRSVQQAIFASESAAAAVLQPSWPLLLLLLLMRLLRQRMASHTLTSIVVQVWKDGAKVDEVEGADEGKLEAMIKKYAANL